MASTSKLSDPTAADLKHDSGITFDAAQWERENVHSVYSSIAPHFSATRFKPWPLVSNFLDTLPPGSIGVDVGCGNGKYLHLRNTLHVDDVDPTTGQSRNGLHDCLTIGSDRSAELIAIAQGQSLSKMSSSYTKGKGKKNSHTDDSDNSKTDEILAQSSQASTRREGLRNEVTVADGLTTCFRSQTFDYAISIATIHHFSTRKRRREAVSELIRLVKPVSDSDSSPGDGTTRSHSSGRGRFLVYVWALEQKGQERRKFDEQAKLPNKDNALGSEGAGASSECVSTETQGRDVLVPWVFKDSNSSGVRGGANAEDRAKAGEQVYQRYYHLFEEKELESLVEEAAAEASRRPDLQRGPNDTQAELCVEKEDSGWERGNWWGVWRCVWRSGLHH